MSSVMCHNHVLQIVFFTSSLDSQLLLQTWLLLEDALYCDIAVVGILGVVASEGPRLER